MTTDTTPAYYWHPDVMRMSPSWVAAAEKLVADPDAVPDDLVPAGQRSETETARALFLYRAISNGALSLIPGPAFRSTEGWAHPGHLPGVHVSTFDADAGEGMHDGALVVQIDTDAGLGRVRINLNDGAVWDGVADDDPRPGRYLTPDAPVAVDNAQGATPEAKPDGPAPGIHAFVGEETWVPLAIGDGEETPSDLVVIHDNESGEPLACLSPGVDGIALGYWDDGGQYVMTARVPYLHNSH